MKTVAEVRTKVDLYLQNVALVESSKGRLCKCCDRRLVIHTKTS